MSNMSRRGALWVTAASAALALTSLAGADDKKEEKKPDDKKGKPVDDKWRAWAVTEGDKTKLVVEGVYSLGGPGLVVLVADAVPQGTNPKILLLDLKTATLPGTWPTVVQPVPAYYSKSPYKKGQYDSIQIRYPDGGTVTIDTITDAGAGPK